MRLIFAALLFPLVAAAEDWGRYSFTPPPSELQIVRQFSVPPVVLPPRLPPPPPAPAYLQTLPPSPPGFTAKK